MKTGTYPYRGKRRKTRRERFQSWHRSLYLPHG